MEWGAVKLINKIIIFNELNIKFLILYNKFGIK
jgi:hypothetical protein